MGTWKFYIYLCIFPTSIFSSDSKTVASDEEKYPEYEYASQEQFGTKGNEETPPAGKDDDTEGKPTTNLGSVMNVFKKPFIVRGQARKGWEEEALIFQLFGRSSLEVDTGNAYQPTVRQGFVLISRFR